MSKLSKIALSALVAAGSLTAALPAQAQSYRGDYNHDRYDNRYDDNRYGYGQTQAIRSQIEQLQQRVARLDGRDRISEREAAGLRRAVYNLRQQFRDYSRNGLSQREAAILQDRIHEIRQRLRYERRDRDGRRW